MNASDFELIQRVLDGDQDAFTPLVNKYQRWVHTLVWRKIGDFHIAQEITQDVFLKAYRKLGSLKPPYHFSGWLYVIATRRCIAWMRKKKQPAASLDAMPAAQLEELSYTQYEGTCAEADDMERQRDLVRCLLEKLPESERTVVTMHYLAEMPCEKISEFLGVSPNTIKSRLHRARKRLEKQEHLLHDVSGIFQVPPSLTANIMREVARIQPTTPSVNKPWLPWGISFASTVWVVLMIGVVPRTVSRFQQPYNLDATSEMTIELIDTRIVLPLKLRPDTRTQLGNLDAPSERRGSGQQVKRRLIATAQADSEEGLSAKPQWIQKNIIRSTDGGDSWRSIGIDDSRSFSVESIDIDYNKGVRAENELQISDGLKWPKTAAVNGVLYVSSSHKEGVRLLCLSDSGARLVPVGGVPHFAEDTLDMEWTKKLQEFRKRNVDINQMTQRRVANFPQIFEELKTNGTFVLADESIFMEYKHKLFRWRCGETAWHDTGVQDPGNFSAPDGTVKGLTLAMSGNAVYAGKRNGSLLQSLDNGNTWNDITESLAFPFTYFKEIIFVGSTVYISTDMGVMSSCDGETWNSLTDIDGRTLPMDSIATDDSNFYGVCGRCVYQVDSRTNTWQQIAPEMPYTAISLAAIGGTLYIGTEHNGVFRFLSLN